MGYNEVLSALHSLIDGASTNLNEIHKLYPKEITSYPAAVLLPSGHEGTYRTLGKVQRRYRLQIVLMQSMNQNTGDFQAAQQRLLTIAEQIMTLFDNTSNLDLNNTVDFSGPTQGEVSYPNEPSQHMQVVITINATTTANL